MVTNGTPILGLYQVNFQWKHSKSSVLSEISIEMYRGQIIGLFGPNGSGKSTLMKLVAGMIPSHLGVFTGQVFYFGKDYLCLSSFQKAQRIVYIGPDLRADFPIKVQEVVSLGRFCRSSSNGYSQAFGGLFRRSSQDDKIIAQAMEQCLCWNLRNRDLNSLSGGEKQLVAIARAIVQGASILFLDEAMSKMDLNHQASMGKLLKELAQQGKTILLVSHDLNLAAGWADSAVFLKSGNVLYQGPIHNAFTQEKIQKMYPETPIVIGVNPSTGAPQIFFKE